MSNLANPLAYRVNIASFAKSGAKTISDVRLGIGLGHDYTEEITCKNTTRLLEAEVNGTKYILSLGGGAKAKDLITEKIILKAKDFSESQICDMENHEEGVFVATEYLDLPSFYWEPDPPAELPLFDIPCDGTNGIIGEGWEGAFFNQISLNPNDEVARLKQLLADFAKPQATPTPETTQQKRSRSLKIS